jgi:hypothetical protein
MSAALHEPLPQAQRKTIPRSVRLLRGGARKADKSLLSCKTHTPAFPSFLCLLSVIPARAKSFRRKRYLRGMRESKKEFKKTTQFRHSRVSGNPKRVFTNKNNMKRIDII